MVCRSFLPGQTADLSYGSQTERFPDLSDPACTIFHNGKKTDVYHHLAGHDTDAAIRHRYADKQSSLPGSLVICKTGTHTDSCYLSYHNGKNDAKPYTAKVISFFR